MICNAAHRDPPFYIGNESPFVQTAIECQETLGVEAILRGFHHVQWQETISKLWVPPQALSNGKAPKCKSPPELAVSLVSQAWDLFETMWNTRNDILHSPESALFEKKLTVTAPTVSLSLKGIKTTGSDPLTVS